MLKKTFIIGASFSAECCNKPHVYLEKVKAKTMSEALTKVENKLKRKEFEVFEVLGMR